LKLNIVKLLSPLILIATIIALLRSNELRFWAPLGSVCLINLGPLWWVLGVLGLLVIGFRSRRIPQQSTISRLFLLAELCYALSIASSFVFALPLSDPNSAPYSAVSQTVWLSFLILNVFSALAFFAAAILSRRIRSWRPVVALLLSLAIVVPLLVALAIRYPFPTD
jgi:hypothetical protein